MPPVSAALLLTVALLLAPDAALAYGGPGSVISGIGAVLAALGALLAALLGFVWYPLKRLYRYVAETEEPEQAPAEPAGE
jgi:Kef-type K+ transport system membrane component KefB